MLRERTRHAQKAATRQLILDAAYQLYGERGFQIPAGEIARAAGVAHGTVFAHFPQLADLTICLLEQFANELKGQLHTACQPPHSLHSFLAAHLAVLQRHEAFYTRLISQSEQLPREARSLLVSIQSVLALHFGQILGKREGVPPHLLFNTWIGLLHHYLRERDLFAPSGSVLERYGRELISYFCVLAGGCPPTTEKELLCL